MDSFIIKNHEFLEILPILLCKMTPLASRQFLIFEAESSSRPF